MEVFGWRVKIHLFQKKAGEGLQPAGGDQRAEHAWKEGTINNFQRKLWEGVPLA